MMKNPLVVVACLVVGTPVLAANPRPCHGRSLDRNGTRQGTLLWGMNGEGVLASVALDGALLEDKTLSGLRLEGGRLVASSAFHSLEGVVFQGKTLDGKSVEVALCRAEPDRMDPSRERYQIEVWRPERAMWENPCMATNPEFTPRALAVPGVWDARGARQEEAGTFTFACEAGAIAKCVEWGYKPWEEKDGKSLADIHQACTRMARADYCGNGSSHTRDGSPIDVYDERKVMTRSRVSSTLWDVRRGSFEAAWSTEGASCLSHTRDGRAVDEVMAECPDLFQRADKDLGEGDRCTVVRKEVRAEEAPLRNRSYGHGEQALFQGAAP
ncbi:hypothetical protein D187_005865 [Cystobacter fuscus DSM 2262]|uniref:ADYC domain-containing protein n=1 Tax=Cystobacter fuscus (strain ATCC 25194 / DSM 2262 / NBRC 100088 / M29) TaxID=1242864 RepID=S9QQ86_CYSF2|nr:ADYC domain-containing protein [Cystobacter fuscus]EPX63459.1 hypothetical protein D187_005865 [Cystobacter fuscus DSM 2262]